MPRYPAISPSAIASFPLTDLASECLSRVPLLSDFISKIEKHIRSDPQGRFRDDDSVMPESDWESWRRSQWIGYLHFIEAGKDSGVLPCVCCVGLKDADATLTTDIGETPFSPLAMRAALDICGYTHKVNEPADVRLLAKAMVDLAKSELNEFFKDPASALRHVSPLHTSRDGLLQSESAGAEKAMDVKLAIQSRLLTISVWSTIIERLDRVDWNDTALLVNLASDPSYASKTKGIPLCAALWELQQHEEQSGLMLRILFDNWWNKGNDNPISRGASPQSLGPELRRGNPERERQAITLEGLSRLERAVVRVCRPALHPLVPLQISLLDLEQLLLEKPTRLQRLSGSLYKAIGCHAMVVHAHTMLYLYIGKRAYDSGLPPNFDPIIPSAFQSDIPPECQTPPRTIPDHARHTLYKSMRYDSTFRDERMVWFMSRTSPINWAHYLSFHPVTALPVVRGRELKEYLDARSQEDFGCGIIDLVDTDNPRYRKWDWLLPSSDHDADKPSKESTRTRVQEDIWALVCQDFRCTFRPEGKADQMMPAATSTTTNDLTALLSSTSIAQSGHAYLRDNPPVLRPAARAASCDLPVAPPTPAEPDEPRAVFRVNNKQLKLAERLYGRREGNVSWSALVILFRRLGYRAKGMGGSAFHIKPITSDGKSIILYRPHPLPEFTSEEASTIGPRLESTSGWKLEDFVRQPEATPLVETTV